MWQKRKTDKKTRIAIIGHFGGKKRYNDGQTVKTRILYEELKKNTDWEIVKVDTFYKKKHPVRLLIKSMKVFLTINNVIILLSYNGMKMYFPICYFFSKIKGTNVYHDVIGGNLVTYVKRHKYFRKYLNSFKQNWIETDLLRNELKREGIKNVVVIPNFRRVIEKIEIKETIYAPPYQFCIFSRVAKQKGVSEAIDAILNVNAVEGKMICQLDIYGSVEADYKDEFIKMLKKSEGVARYCGEVPSHEAISTLSKYYTTLFPTHWVGESNAGTITESQFAGIPVIATDWRCNNEMITNGYNGLIYPSDLCADLESGIRWMINNSENMFELRKHSLEASERYSANVQIERIINYIKENDK